MAASTMAREGRGLGHAAAFSFYPTKNLGCYGDGGIITTDSEEVFEKAVMLRAYGQTAKHVHAVEGFNSRLDEIQAALLLVKLERLDYWNKGRRHIAWLYKGSLRIHLLSCLMMHPGHTMSITYM